MKRALLVVLVFLLTFTGCSANSNSNSTASSPEIWADGSFPEEGPITDEMPPDAAEAPQGQIYLYGEMHGEEKIVEKELELWYSYYHNGHMRHLFVELPYYDAELLNLWMQEDNDKLLLTVYEGWGEEAAMHDPSVLAFYKQVKSACPETVFHGTDVGHDRETNGKRYLEHLEANGLRESEPYKLALQAMEQGERYTTNGEEDHVYRENMMVENFIREFEALDGESVMGIYGGAHTDFDAMDYSTHTVPCMAAQLKDRYGDAIHAEDLTWLLKDIEPIRVETVMVGEKEYEAAYYGQEDVSWHQVMEYRDFWRLENAYDDFKDMPLDEDYLPEDNYPMPVEVGQVFLIEYTLKDGSTLRMYYRADGNVLEDRLLTNQVAME